MIAVGLLLLLLGMVALCPALLVMGFFRPTRYPALVVDSLMLLAIPTTVIGVVLLILGFFMEGLPSRRTTP